MNVDGTYPEDLMPRCTACEEPFAKLRAALCPECFGDREEGLQVWLLDQCQRSGLDVEVHGATESDGVWQVTGALWTDGREVAAIEATVWPTDPAGFTVRMGGIAATANTPALALSEVVDRLEARRESDARRWALEVEAEAKRRAVIRSHMARFESALPAYLRRST